MTNETRRPPADSCCAFCGEPDVEFYDTQYSRETVDGVETPVVTQFAACEACGATYEDVYVWRSARRTS